MNDVLLIYLTAFVVTLAVLIAGGTALIGFRRAADDAQRRGDEYERQRARLPDATRLEDLKERVGDSERRLDDLREDLADAQVLIDQKRAAEAWLEKHRDELHALEANIEQIEKVKAELAARRDELKTLDERADTCRKEADAAEFRRDRMNEEVESIESKLGHAQQLLNTIEQRISDAAAKESAQSAQLATLEQQIEQRKETAEEQAGELQRLEKRVDETRTQLREVEAEYESTRAKLKGLENQEAALRDSIATLKAMHEKTLEELRGARGQGEEAHAELWQPVLMPRATRRKSLSQEAKALEAVEEHLDALGLHFSSRTLMALHTSLKVAEQSPLTVLAGVSGTGKSELPRRYAEAMGIHFLPLPVQPRWDSPQDMFGFYNYLESRYRPTELTRALIQMDRFGAEEGRGWSLNNGSHDIYKPLEDQMLLVLLDEMNLARVEYYFSDLLSKLETRRGVNRDDPDQRRKAELALEVGQHFGGNTNGDDGGNDQAREAIMRLFVDTNVLFVGTMNEDESTQTLSDKVMDRANVLRFGKPKRLQNGQASNDNGNVSVDVGSLSYKTWFGWIRSENDLPGSIGENVDGWIQRLNDAMNQIGRPFAFRVNRAMRSYVANYPVQGVEAAKVAMADQIELRILPKFRGLDPNEGMVNEALGQVQQVLQDLGDEDLHQAVESSRRAHEHQFVWQGLDRSETGE